MSEPRWRVYYTDGSSYSDLDGPWIDAPPRGVLAVNTRSELVGRELDWGENFYVWWPGAPFPWGVDHAGLWDFLHVIGSDLAYADLRNREFEQLVELGVKFGRTMHTPDFRWAIRQVSNDPDFPARSAMTRKEMRLQEHFGDG